MEVNYPLLNFILAMFQAVILLISAIWAYFRFRKEKPLHPRIEFDIACRFYGPQKNEYLAVFSIIAENKGNVDHTFTEIFLRCRGLKEEHTLEELSDYPGRLNFPKKVFEIDNIIPEKYKYYFVRPGVRESFAFTTKIPETYSYLLVHAAFKYKDANELHTAEQVFEVTAELSS